MTEPNLEQQELLQALKKALDRESSHGSLHTRAHALAEQEVLRAVSGALPELRTDMSPREFEELVADVYRGLGYEVELTQQARDGGVDIVASGDGERIAIECKRYGPGSSVGVRDVAVLHSAAMLRNATSAVFYNLEGKYTADARERAGALGIKLLTGHDLREIMAPLERYKVMCLSCGHVTEVHPNDAQGNCKCGLAFDNPFTHEAIEELKGVYREHLIKQAVAQREQAAAQWEEMARGCGSSVAALLALLVLLASVLS